MMQLHQYVSFSNKIMGDSRHTHTPDDLIFGFNEVEILSLKGGTHAETSMLAHQASHHKKTSNSNHPPVVISMLI